MANEMLEGLIGDTAATVLAEIRDSLEALAAEADSLDKNGEVAKNARLIREHVDEFFLLVVIGEVKSGKSSFINALLGEKVQAEGPLPLTDRIWVLRHGEHPSERIQEEFVYEKVHPNKLLKLFNMVDTPGTNSIVQRHGEITLSFIPKADLTLFITSIDRPFSESEHQFLNYVNARWRKKVIFILTKIDTHPEADVAPVVEFIQDNCRKFYDFEPRVFPVSARLADEAAKSGDRALLAKSGLPALEEFLASSLAEQERVQLKLTSPVEAGLALLDEMGRLAAGRRELLERDFQSLNDLDVQLKQAGAELKERYNTHVLALYDLLRDFERRGKNFFETTIKVGNFGLLRDAEAYQRRFEKEVVGELKDEIQRVMHAATDWLMKEQIALYERSLRYLADRLMMDKYKDRVAARSPRDQSFEYHRDQLVSSIQTSFRREIDRFDVAGECNRMMAAAYKSILTQLGVQAGAVGLGALLVTLLSTAVLDVTGVLAAGVLFAAGFVVLPRTKRRMIQDFSMKVDALIREFRRAICIEFDAEIEQNTDRLRAAYEPYLQFYRAETEVLAASEKTQRSLRLRLMEILQQVKTLAPHGNGSKPAGKGVRGRPGTSADV